MTGFESQQLPSETSDYFCRFFVFHFRQGEHFSRTWLSYHEKPHWGFRCNVLNASEIYYKKLLLHNLKANRKCRFRAQGSSKLCYTINNAVIWKDIRIATSEEWSRRPLTVHCCLCFFGIWNWRPYMSHLGNHSNKKLSWTREIMWITVSDMTQMCDYMPTSDS